MLDHSAQGAVTYRFDRTDTGDMTYWEFGPMLQSVEQTTSALTDETSVGLYVYPEIIRMTAPMTGPGCMTPSTLAISIAAGNATAVMPWLHQYGSNDGHFEQFYQPAGGAPLSVALNVVADALVAAPGAAATKFVVLVGISPPNCNGTIQLAECICLGTPGSNGCWYSPNAMERGLICSDLERASAGVRALRTAGIRTLVIGDDLGDMHGGVAPFMDEIWTRLAEAGGMAAVGSRHWFGVRDHAGIERAVRTRIAASGICNLHVVGPHNDLDGYQLVSRAGSTIAFDVTRIDGWDWTDAALGRLSVFGSSCERLIADPSEMFLRHPTRVCDIANGDRE